MRLTTINEAALIDVATLLVGAQATNAILAVYQLVDRSQAEAYALGESDTKLRMEEALDAAFDNGFEYGESQARLEAEADLEDKVNEAGDDGYVQGVADARARPEKADAIVAEIVACLDQHAINDVDVLDGEGKVNAHPEGASWEHYFDDGGPYNEPDWHDAVEAREKEERDLEADWCDVCYSYSCGC